MSARLTSRSQRSSALTRFPGVLTPVQEFSTFPTLNPTEWRRSCFHITLVEDSFRVMGMRLLSRKSVQCSTMSLVTNRREQVMVDNAATKQTTRVLARPVARLEIAVGDDYEQFRALFEEAVPPV